VTREIRSGETSTSYISRRCARMSRTVMPRAYKATTRSLKPLQPGLALTHDPRAEGPVPVPGHRQVHRSRVGGYRLGSGTVAAAAAAAPGRVVFLVARVAGHLLGQRPFQHGPGHLRQQTVRAEQLRALGLGPPQQLIGQVIIDQRPARLPAFRITGHVRTVVHCVSFHGPQFLRPVVRPRHLHSW
jgi:hypothetical protein